MTPAETLNRAAMVYARAVARLEHHTLTEGDIIEKNRAERELREAAREFSRLVGLDGADVMKEE